MVSVIIVADDDTPSSSISVATPPSSSQTCPLLSSPPPSSPPDFDFSFEDPEMDKIVIDLYDSLDNIKNAVKEDENWIKEKSAGQDWAGLVDMHWYCSEMEQWRLKNLLATNSQINLARNKLIAPSITRSVNPPWNCANLPSTDHFQ
jgi:hypothetical protein